MKLNASLLVNVFSDIENTTSPKQNDFLYNRDFNNLSVCNSESLSCSMPPLSRKDLVNSVRTLTPLASFDICISSELGYGNSMLLGSDLSGLKQERIAGNLITINSSFTINRLSPTVVRITFSDNLADTIMINDNVYLGLGTTLDSTYWDSFNIITVKSLKIIDIISTNLPDGQYNITADKGVYIFIQEGVQKGDILDLTSARVSYPNRGLFEIKQVTSRFLLFSNPNAIEEVDIFTEDIVIVKAYYKYVYIETNKKIEVLLNGQAFNVSPPIQNDDTSVGFFFSSTVFKSLSIVNQTPEIAKITVFISG